MAKTRLFVFVRPFFASQKVSYLCSDVFLLRKKVNSLFLEYSGFLSLPVLLFLVRTFVVLFLAFAQSNLKFGATLVPMQVQRDERVALAFHSAG